MTMMALAKTKLHLSINLLTKDLSLLELNQKYSTHIHTLRCQLEMVMIYINGQAMRPINEGYSCQDLVYGSINALARAKSVQNVAVSSFWSMLAPPPCLASPSFSLSFCCLFLVLFLAFTWSVLLCNWSLFD